MVISLVMQLISMIKSIGNRFCRRIELDFYNESVLRKHYSFVNKDIGGIRHIETETIRECLRRARNGNPAEYRYLGTRFVYRVENEHEFLLLLIKTAIEYKEVNPNSYCMTDEGND